MSSTPSTPKPYFDEQGRTDAEVYLTDIYDGKIVASKHMRKLADIMLPRFYEEYHGAHYSPKKGIRVCRFVEDFTCFPEGEKMGQPFLLEQFQRSAIEIVYGFVDENDRRTARQALMLLARKNGKAISLNSDIPTPDGWRKMGDLHVGDVVFGQDGKPSTIIAESEIFNKPMYLVTFEDGSQIRASEDHIWTVRNHLGFVPNRSGGSSPFKGRWFNVTTKTLFNDIDKNT